MKGHGFLRVLPVLVHCCYFPRIVTAQFGMGPSPLLSLEDYDSDEMIPLVRQVRVPETANHKQSSLETFPISEDMLKQLRSLLIVAPENKITKLKLPRKSASKTTVKYTPTVTSTMPTTSSSTTMSTMSTTSNPTTERPLESREVGKKWFPLLLQEAIDNILQKNSSEMDELDELVDQIASGSRPHRHETYEAPPASYRSSYDHHGMAESDVAGLNLPAVNLDQFSTGVPYVVNIFNNTNIGYIVMKVSNDSEIRLEPPEDAIESATVSNEVERKTRRTVPAEEQEYSMMPFPNSVPHQKLMPKPVPKELPKVQYIHKPKTSVPLPGRPPSVEPPFFNILNTADNEPLKYRVLLRNNDAPPEKINVRLPLPGQLVSAPANIFTEDRRPNPFSGRQVTGKRKPMYQEQPTVLRSRLPAESTIESLESRPSRRTNGIGRVARKYNYESVEDELPYDELNFTNPDTNTVTQRTAKILSSGKHSPTVVESSEMRHRTTPEPYSEKQKYNVGRTVGTTDFDADASEQQTTTQPSSADSLANLADLPGDDVLFNQAPENRMVKAGHDSTVDAYRRKRKDRSDVLLKRSVPTSDGALNELFEHGTGKGRRHSKGGGGHRWDSLDISEEDSVSLA